MIIIPDIHGRAFWKPALAGRENDRIIFLGDYTDPYAHEGIDACEGVRALVEVIDFKKEHSDSVTLLLGNHDLGYISDHICCSRHDEENHAVIRSLIEENIKLFDIAHDERVGQRRVVFSHAGIHPDWLKGNELKLGKVRHEDVPTLLNELFHSGLLYEELGNVSWYRGGDHVAGSCVWADMNEFVDIIPSRLQGSFQVFGHTQFPQPVITEYFACLDCRSAFTLDEDFGFTKIE